MTVVTRASGIILKPSFSSELVNLESSMPCTSRSTFDAGKPSITMCTMWGSRSFGTVAVSCCGNPRGGVLLQRKLAVSHAGCKSHAAVSTLARNTISRPQRFRIRTAPIAMATANQATIWNRVGSSTREPNENQSMTAGASSTAACVIDRIAIATAAHATSAAIPCRRAVWMDSGIVMVA
jgi:hypothetical protein